MHDIPNSNDPRDIAVWVSSGFDELKSDILKQVEKRLEDQHKAHLAAFVDENPHSHKLWHEQEKESSTAQKELARDIIKKAIIGTLGTLAYLNWDAIRVAFKLMMSGGGDLP